MPQHLGMAARPACERSAESPITIVLADGHEGVRRSLRLLLEGERGLEVVAEASDLEEVCGALRRHRPGVAVLDLVMAGEQAGAAIGELYACAPDTRIVAVSMNDTPALARALLDAGASGFVLKELADPDLPTAIRRARSGETYVSPRMAERLPRRRHPARGTVAKLAIDRNSA